MIWKLDYFLSRANDFHQSKTWLLSREFRLKKDLRCWKIVWLFHNRKLSLSERIPEWKLIKDSACVRLFPCKIRTRLTFSFVIRPPIKVYMKQKREIIFMGVKIFELLVWCEGIWQTMAKTGEWYVSIDISIDPIWLHYVVCCDIHKCVYSCGLFID